MRLNYLSILFVVFGIFLSACSDDEKDGSVSIRFKMEYDGQPTVIFDRYNYPDGYEIFFSRFSFFASNIQLISGTTAIEVNDVEYWNFTDDHADLASAQQGMVLNYGQIPAGNYSGISFNIGVPQDLNAQVPADFDSANPLSNVAEYWADWNSYIFMKTEGKMDPDGDDSFDDGFALHIGSNDAFRSVNLSAPFSVQAGQTTEVVFVIDLLDMFRIGTEMYELAQRPQIHSLEALPNVLPLMDNLASGAIR